MAEVSLKAIKREGSGKGVARRARASGRVPAVVYGKGMEPVAIEVDRREFVTALLTDAGLNVLLNIEIDGTSTTAITRELQRDPVRGTLLHADFVKIDLTQEIEVEVPVHLVGESPGAKEGGVLEHPLFTIHVRCLPSNVPESIDADISGLNIGDQLRVAELATGRDFEILNDPDTVVASVAAPITEEQLEAMVAEVGTAEEAAEEAAAVPEGEEAAPTEEEGAAPAPAEGAPEGSSPEGEAG
ncbi:MAG: 50S ribosomal protein L25/general stress protein Ctc [Actinomycetota bacterium]|nr:50S ribosomal protein L25/general stress protein Ctc [Actinomycetota bacterium]